MLPISRLCKLDCSGGKYVEDKTEKVWVFHVDTPHLLVQASGYLKHIHGKNALTGVFYRGQERLYGGALQPSLYRGLKRQAESFKERNRLIRDYANQCFNTSAMIQQVPAFAKEPLLQHYGIRTTWIDLVDNIWVALWFSCYTAHSIGRNSQYIHFEQRKLLQASYAYILLIQVSVKSDELNPGYFTDGTTELVDLRIAVPSTFVRPHAQHGLLARAKPNGLKQHIEYSDMVVGIIRVDLSNALEWLGDGMLLTPHVLFPSPVYDFGYRDLLEYSPRPSNILGAIHHVSV